MLINSVEDIAMCNYRAFTKIEVSFPGCKDTAILAKEECMAIMNHIKCIPLQKDVLNHFKKMTTYLDELDTITKKLEYKDYDLSREVMTGLNSVIENMLRDKIKSDASILATIIRHVKKWLREMVDTHSKDVYKKAGEFLNGRKREVIK